MTTQYDAAFDAAAKAFGLDVKVLKGIAQAESNFDPKVISGQKTSKKGAVGLMQFMPATAKELGVDPTNAEQSIFAAAQYLKQNLDKFEGDYSKAVAAYNWGPNRKAFTQPDWKATLPSETQDYLGKVFGFATASTAAPTAAAAPAAAPTSTEQLISQIPTEGARPIPVSQASAARSTPSEAWRQRIEFVAPTIETIAAAGGTMLGAPAGPPGMILGGATGYAGGRQLVDYLKTLAGEAPRPMNELMLDPVRNALISGTTEVAFRGLGPYVVKGFGKVADLPQIATQRAARIMRKTLGTGAEAGKQILREADPSLSPAQALADVDKAAFQTLMRDMAKRDPDFAEALATAQKEASEEALVKMAGGKTATETRKAAELAKQTLTDITSPARQAALTRANMGQRVAEFEQQAGKLSEEAAAQVQQVRDLTRKGSVAAANAANEARLEAIRQGLPASPRAVASQTQGGYATEWATEWAKRHSYPGQLAARADEWASKAAEGSLDLGQAGQFAQSAADSLRAAGIKPLETGSLIEKLRGILRDPELAALDEVKASVPRLIRDLQEWTKNGVIDARALDAIRKNSVTASIRNLMGGADANAQKKLAAGVLSRVSPLIDDAIESAGGAGWKDYLKDYSQGMMKINEQKLTGQALKLWQTNKDGFVALVKGESDDVVEKFLGPGKFDIATELADDTMRVLRAEAAKAIRDAKITERATKGEQALKIILAEETQKFRLPSLISAAVSAANKGLDRLEAKIGAKTLAILGEAAKSNKKAADLLSVLPATERNRVLKILSDPSGWAGVGAAMAPETVKPSPLPEPVPISNYLAGPQQRQNALAP